MIPKPVKTAITTAGFVAVKVPDAPDTQVPFGVHTEDSSGFYIAVDEAGTDAVLYPADSPKPAWRAKPEADGTVFYAKGTTSTNIIVTRWRP